MDNLSLDAELDIRLGKATTMPGSLTSRVWNNWKLTTKTKMAVYSTWVISTLLGACDGLPSRDKRRGSMYSSWEASARCWVSPGKIRSQTLKQMYYLVLVSLAWTLFWDRRHGLQRHGQKGPCRYEDWHWLLGAAGWQLGQMESYCEGTHHGLLG